MASHFCTFKSAALTTSCEEAPGFIQERWRPHPGEKERHPGCLPVCCGLMPSEWDAVDQDPEQQYEGIVSGMTVNRFC